MDKNFEEKEEVMVTTYEERLKELFGELQLAPYYVSIENLATDRPLTNSEKDNVFDKTKYLVYIKWRECC